MLRQKFHFCSTAIKNKLFIAHVSNIYLCVVWVNCRKANFQQFVVAYNNSYRILTRMPSLIHSLMTRTDKSLNPITQNIAISDMYRMSKLRHQWILALINF